MDIAVYSGGLFSTNAFFLKDAAGGPGVLIDAPQGVVEWLAKEGLRVGTLLLTHGHIDHTWEAAAVQRAHAARVVCHPETVPMVKEADFYTKLGFGWEIETLTPDETTAEPGPTKASGLSFEVLDLPGHCPGSVGFYLRETGMIFSGDVLFSGGVGRVDLPGGDWDVLIESIQKLFTTLLPETKVLSGHGPVTTLATEKATNPFLR